MKSPYIHPSGKNAAVLAVFIISANFAACQKSDVTIDRGSGTGAGRNADTLTKRTPDRRPGSIILSSSIPKPAPAVHVETPSQLAVIGPLYDAIAGFYDSLKVADRDVQVFEMPPAPSGSAVLGDYGRLLVASGWTEASAAEWSKDPTQSAGASSYRRKLGDLNETLLVNYHRAPPEFQRAWVVLAWIRHP